MRVQNEYDVAHPDREPDEAAECQDGTMLVWFEGKRTISEVSGAHQNMGAYWCWGRVSAQKLATEYDCMCNEE